MPLPVRRRSSLAVAALAALALSCAHSAPAPGTRALVPVRVLALNDFHGQLEPGEVLQGRPAGGAPVLASWLRAARAGREGATLLVSAGDLVGASPPASALLQDEPAISFLNLLAGEACAPIPSTRRTDREALEGDPRCDVVATVGNHELDEGLGELLRLVRGGDHSRGPFLEAPWRGARFPFVAANVVDARTGAPIFPPAVVRELGGARVGVVGAVFREVADVVDPTGVAGIAFPDPADAVNRAVRELSDEGVRAVVVLLHDGGEQAPYAGATRDEGEAPRGAIAAFVARLDGEVDAVVSAHTHAFTNARLPNAAGRPVLVTQAFSSGAAFARIDLGLDPATGDVARASAEIVPALADEGPGLTPDPQATRLLAMAREAVAPRLSRVVAAASAPIRRGPRTLGDGDSGEHPLGNLVADAFRRAMEADVAFVQVGGLRADLPGGPITWGDIYAVQPFGNVLVRMTLSGREIKELLEQQWMDHARPSWRPEPYILQVSGLRFTWDATRPAGERIVEVTRGGAPLAMEASFLVAVPRFLAGGGDRFTAFAVGRDRAEGPLDVEALAAHLASLPQPVVVEVDGRITRR
jgi:5'-nucleotidase